MLNNAKGVIGNGLDRMLKREAELDLYRVRVHYDLKECKRIEVHIVHGREDLERLLKATLELHFKPGKNPYTGGETSEAQLIAVAPLAKKEPRWWSTPGLQKDGDSKDGAHIYEWSEYDAVWARPGAEIPSAWGYKID